MTPKQIDEASKLLRKQEKLADLLGRALTSNEVYDVDTLQLRSSLDRKITSNVFAFTLEEDSGVTTSGVGEVIRNHIIDRLTDAITANGERLRALGVDLSSDEDEIVAPGPSPARLAC